MSEMTAVAILKCGHTVRVYRPSEGKAEQSRQMMEQSAFCEECGKVQPTVQTYMQRTIFA